MIVTGIKKSKKTKVIKKHNAKQNFFKKVCFYIKKVKYLYAIPLNSMRFKRIHENLMKSSGI